MEIRLISHTPNPEKVIAAAARLCYSPTEVADIMANFKEGEEEKMVDKLSNMGHLSPFEHASFTFSISGISRACSHQLIRHRVASYSQRSQRYVKSLGEYVMPPKVKQNLKARKIFDDCMDNINKAYKEIAEELYIEAFNAEFVPSPQRAKELWKQSFEDARFVLPNAATTSIVVTMNARELLHFFEARCCSRAQWEINKVAWDMLDICEKLSRPIFKNGGPSCSSGRCKEGSMSCGQPVIKK